MYTQHNGLKWTPCSWEEALNEYVSQHHTKDEPRFWLLDKKTMGNRVRSTKHRRVTGGKEVHLTWWTGGVWPQCCDASCTSWSELNRCLWLPLEIQSSQVHMMKHTHTNIHKDVTRGAYCTFTSPLCSTETHTAVINIYIAAISGLCYVNADKKHCILKQSPGFCLLLPSTSVYTRPWFASRRWFRHSLLRPNKVASLVSVCLSQSQGLRDPVLRAANLQL